MISVGIGFVSWANVRLSEFNAGDDVTFFIIVLILLKTRSRSTQTQILVSVLTGTSVLVRVLLDRVGTCWWKGTVVTITASYDQCRPARLA